MMTENVARSSPISHVEEHRLAGALLADVERIDAVALAACDERGATVGGHQGQHRICAISRLVGKIDSRVEMTQHAATEYGEQDVRSLRLAVGIGHHAGLDGAEGIGAVLIGAAAAKTLEGRV